MTIYDCYGYDCYDGYDCYGTYILRFYYDMLQSATQGIVAMVTSLSPSALAALAGVSHTLR